MPGVVIVLAYVLALECTEERMCRAGSRARPVSSGVCDTLHSEPPAPRIYRIVNVFLVALIVNLLTLKLKKSSNQ